MSDKPKVADWAPGTLSATKRAIGDIDADEAKRMVEVLGGEVMYEKDPEPDKNEKKSKRGALDRSVIEKNKENDKKRAQVATPAPTIKQEELITIPSKSLKKMNKLMQSPDYRIKKTPGPFWFLQKLFSKADALDSEFMKLTVKMQVDALEMFDKKIIEMIALTPPAYTAFIENNSDAKFILLRTVRTWDVKNIDYLFDQLMNKEVCTVQDMIPYIRAVFGAVFKIYYYGPDKIPELLKEIYTDCAENVETPKKKLLSASKEAIRLWSIIEIDVIKRLYPLLMRMCSITFEVYPNFFDIRRKEILAFLGLHKYDIMFPGMQNSKIAQDATASAAANNANQKPKQDALVINGLSLLEKLFPEAGFQKLDEHPDMYPYFSPLYHFADGFNAIAPRNPLQVTIVLVRIIEDIFQGLRDVQFITSAIADEKADNITKIIDDWSNYREVVFKKLYLGQLNELVNRIYTQDDFADSQFAKKIRTELSWQVNYHFLPYYSVERLTLEKPIDESNLPPLYNRTTFAKQYLAKVVKVCDEKKESRGDAIYVKNPWVHYHFAVPNEVSKRIDVLLGAKDKSPNTKATNAALLKYALRLIAVLDWWINNEDSPAYDATTKDLYRTNEDGNPDFNVTVRKDQNKLFADACRAAYKKSKEKANNAT